MLQFIKTREESDLAFKIADRAVKLLEKCGVDYPYLVAIMDIEVTHCNGNPLDLAALLAAPQGEFAHDVFGIRRHLNRETGKLGGCFSPRYSKPGADEQEIQDAMNEAEESCS